MSHLIGGSPKLLNNQDYHSLATECARSESLFEDSDFPAESSSLCMKSGVFKDGLQWRRPWELCNNPRLLVDGSSVHDVVQGEVGDCWLISAMGSVACFPEYLRMVIPHCAHQEECMFSRDKYCGIFCFRLWRCGTWVEVVIDDRLPTRDGKLAFARSSQHNEFWCALLEKAYAKLMGCYELLIAGQEEEGLVDLTGGVPECLYSLSTQYTDEAKIEKVFRLVHREFQQHCVICGSIGASQGDGMETQLSNGLVTTHAYTITATQEFVSSKDNKTVVRLIKLRNPWGHREWNGAFSDESADWNFVPDNVRQAIALHAEDDGEFWIDFKDFIHNFDTLTIVRVLSCPFSGHAALPGKGGGEHRQTGITAAPQPWVGMKQNLWYLSEGLTEWSLVTVQRESVFSNTEQVPQFYFQVDSQHNQDKSEVLLHVLQNLPRTWHCTMGILLGRVEYNRRTPVCHQRHCNLLMDYKVSGSRTLCFRRKLAPGAYVLIPYLCQAAPDQKPVQYLLRVLTPNVNHGRFLNLPRTSRRVRNREAKQSTSARITKLCENFAPFTSRRTERRTVSDVGDSVNSEQSPENMNQVEEEGDNYRLMSSVTLHGGNFIPAEEMDEATFTCEIICEDQTLMTSASKNGSSPIWEESFLLYRKTPQEHPILIKIWKRHTGERECIGQMEMSYTERERSDPTQKAKIESLRPEKWFKLELFLTIYHMENDTA